eukprot:CAMPEP_0119510522 /NCGR_PEP_ID=MMETSP1344-20130328/29484_1 /TAXON_ID=236787 /ORGANISM="Florenciella parvula, Strain CCMP2471" /LENGTH=93 /DNA_ID=CAMNT_0007547459 /DNA_START=45 /DNA_END=323 /DNA_ORIENTATION=+
MRLKPPLVANARKALVNADECQSLRPDWSKGHFRRAAALERLERPSEAAAAYEAAISCEGADSAASTEIVAKLDDLRHRMDASVASTLYFEHL